MRRGYAAVDNATTTVEVKNNEEVPTLASKT